MAIKDYWLYQKRDVPTPWAIYFVKEYDRRDPDATQIDYTFYHEDVPSNAHSKSYVGLHHLTPRGYADEIVAEISDYVSIASEDYDQILKELERILA